MGEAAPDRVLFTRHCSLAHGGNPAEEGNRLADPLIGEGRLDLLLDVAQLCVEEVGSSRGERTQPQSRLAQSCQSFLEKTVVNSVDELEIVLSAHVGSATAEGFVQIGDGILDTLLLSP